MSHLPGHTHTRAGQQTHTHAHTPPSHHTPERADEHARARTQRHTHTQAHTHTQTSPQSFLRTWLQHVWPLARKLLLRMCASACITALTSECTNLSPFTKGCRDRDASMWLYCFLRNFQIQQIVQFRNKPSRMQSYNHPHWSMLKRQCSKTGRANIRMFLCSIIAFCCEFQNSLETGQTYERRESKISRQKQAFPLAEARSPIASINLCYGWLHRRLQRRYRPQSAVRCSTLWERAAGSPPNTGQVGLSTII